MVTEQKPLHKIFTAVPDRYDLINRIFTWGQDAKWRRKTAALCLETQPVKILDLCCGTGDLAIDLARLAPSSTAGSRPRLQPADAGESQSQSGPRGVNRRIEFYLRRRRGFAFCQ